MERETKKVTTPVGKVEVELKSWLTGGEKIALLKADTDIEALLKQVVVSPKYEDIMNLHGKDFDYLISEITKIGADSSWSEEKKS